MSAQATPHTFPIHPQDTLPETDTLGGQEPPELGKVTSEGAQTLPGEDWACQGQTVLLALKAGSFQASMHHVAWF